MYAVILAGGGGTRLWPLSRPERPKPFLPLLGEETLIQRTVRRIAPLVGSQDLFCVTDRRFGQIVREQIPDVGLIVEPNGRNTAAAITLATAAIDRPENEVMLVLPADHWIEREEEFRRVLSAAVDRLATGAFDIESPLVTLGIQPDYPSTDYGYLLPDTMRATTVEGVRAYPLTAFEEKPVEHRARELLGSPASPGTPGCSRGAAARSAPRSRSTPPLMTLIEPAIGSDLALAAAYDRLKPISIDRAVMEGAAADHRVVMGAMDVGWSDLGSWSALLGALAALDGQAPAAHGSRRAGRRDGRARRRTTCSSTRRRAASPSRRPRGGTIVADSVWAHLAGALPLRPAVQALLDRVASQEVRA